MNNQIDMFHYRNGTFGMNFFFHKNIAEFIKV